MDIKDFYKAYAAERRGQNIEGFSRFDAGHLVRYLPAHDEADGIIIYANLTLGQEQQQIQEQIDYFAALKMRFEWKIYDFDLPSILKALLDAKGFVAGEQEAFMVLDLHGLEVDEPLASETTINTPWHIRRIEDRAGVEDVVAVQEAVWQRKFSWLIDQLLNTLEQNPDQLSIYCAYDGTKPIGTAWVEYPPGSSYPEIHGGAVLEAWRGQGIYADLYRQRLPDIKMRGYQYITVDATPMSRPMLEKLGFRLVCFTYPMIYHS